MRVLAEGGRHGMGGWHGSNNLAINVTVIVGHSLYYRYLNYNVSEGGECGASQDKEVKK